MSTDPPPEGTQRPPDPDHDFPDFNGDGWDQLTSLKVTDGRVYVPDRDSERYGVDEGDVLDVLLEPLNENIDSIFLEDVPVGSDTRLLIPPNVRKINGLEGETVDLLFRQTGKTYDP